MQLAENEKFVPTMGFQSLIDEPEVPILTIKWSFCCKRSN
jgi:hypothetical protein